MLWSEIFRVATVLKLWSSESSIYISGLIIIMSLLSDHLFQSAEPTKRCDRCSTPAASNRAKCCRTCSPHRYYLPAGTSAVDRQFWTEINNAERTTLDFRLVHAIDTGANINMVIGGQTGLMIAIRKGNNDIVQLLVAQPELNINFQGRHHTTAILLAARFRSDVLATLLSVPNINVNCQTLAHGLQGMTPLMIAVHFNKPINARMLLQKGVDLTITDILGNTALTMRIHHPYKRHAMKVVQGWYERIREKFNRLRYTTVRKRRRREKGLARHVSSKKSLPDDVEGIIKGNLHHHFDPLKF